MNIVQPEKRAKTKKMSELVRGEHFTCDGEVNLATAIEYPNCGYAVTVAGRAGDVWGNGKQVNDPTVTLCDKDGNPEMEEAGEEVDYHSVPLGGVFAYKSEPESVQFKQQDTTRVAYLSDGQCGDESIDHAEIVIYYSNAELNLGKAASDGKD